MDENSRPENSDPSEESHCTLLPLQQAADEASCSVSTLRNLIARGDLTAYRFGPRLIRVRRKDLEALLRPYQGGQAGSWSHL